MNRYFAVMLGGAFGSVIRYALNLAIASRYPSEFPVATFLINLTGSFLIGIAYPLLPSQDAPLLRPLLMTGVLGGFTTFSAFELETLLAPRGIALIYVAASVGFGLLACWCGLLLGRSYTR